MSHEGCQLPTPSQAHCSVCHRTFSGMWAFDKHRRDGRCLDPAELGLVERDRIWRRPGSDRPTHWQRPGQTSSE